MRLSVIDSCKSQVSHEGLDVIGRAVCELALQVAPDEFIGVELGGRWSCACRFIAAAWSWPR
jgi:hypothetical protein